MTSKWTNLWRNRDVYPWSLHDVTLRWLFDHPWIFCFTAKNTYPGKNFERQHAKIASVLLALRAERQQHAHTTPAQSTVLAWPARPPLRPARSPTPGTTPARISTRAVPCMDAATRLLPCLYYASKCWFNWYLCYELKSRQVANTSRNLRPSCDLRYFSRTIRKSSWLNNTLWIKSNKIFYWNELS